MLYEWIIITNFASPSRNPILYGWLKPLFSGFFYLYSMQKVNFYIDGFNFYYGLRAAKKADPQWCHAYWIDFVKLCRNFLGADQELGKVIYFTAKPLGYDKAARQRMLLKANKALHPDLFEVVEGRYLSKNILCPNCRKPFPRPEEKKTDVNISVRLLGDCMANAADRIVLVSADSDLIPPINFILENFPGKKIKVFFPPTLSSKETMAVMRKKSGKVVFMKNNYPKFKESVMPDDVKVGNATYTIPEKWKARLP